MIVRILLVISLFSISYANLRQDSEFDVTTTTSQNQQQTETLMVETFNSSKCIACINTNINEHEGVCSSTDYPSTCQTNFHIYKLMFLQCILSLNCQYDHKIGYSNKCICQCLNLTENIVAVTNTQEIKDNTQANETTEENQTEDINETTETTEITQTNGTTETTEVTEANETADATDTATNTTKTSSESLTKFVDLIPLEVLQQNPAIVNLVECYLQASCGGLYTYRSYQNCSIILFSRKIWINLINFLTFLFFIIIR